MQPKKKALGRGLEALLPPKPKTAAPQDNNTVAGQPGDGSGKQMMAITSIRRNEKQPRQYFDEEALQTLADSLKRHGFIQPIAVMPRGDKDFVVVAGERRLRAAQLAGLREVPVIVMEPLSDKEVLEFALVENLQRENLNPLEEARAFKALQDGFNLSAEEVAEAVGKSRSAVANALRLLQMPADMQEDLETERISPGHARAIYSLENQRDQKALRDRIVQDNMSVRQAELHAKTLQEMSGVGKVKKNPAGKVKPGVINNAASPELATLRDSLTDALSCRVAISSLDGKKGKVEIYFETLDDLQGLLDKLGVEM